MNAHWQIFLNQALAVCPSAACSQRQVVGVGGDGPAHRERGPRALLGQPLTGVHSDDRTRTQRVVRCERWGFSFMYLFLVISRSAPHHLHHSPDYIDDIWGCPVLVWLLPEGDCKTRI